MLLMRTIKTNLVIWVKQISIILDADDDDDDDDANEWQRR